jgi:hypothetical protein
MPIPWSSPPLAMATVKESCSSYEDSARRGGSEKARLQRQFAPMEWGAYEAKGTLAGREALQR